MSLRVARNWQSSRRYLDGIPHHAGANLPERIETPEEIHDILVGLANSYEEDIAQFDHEEVFPSTTARPATTTTAKTTKPPPIVWFPSEPECPGTESEKG